MSDKAIIVTGATKGIGLATTLALANAGFIVYAGYRSEGGKEELTNCGLNKVKPILLDVTDEGLIDAARKTIEADGVCLYGLVNNAGCATLGPLEYIPIPKAAEQFDINLYGQIRMIQAFLPMLRESKGRIVNISSISGFVGFPYFSLYASSKHALEGLNDALRRELKPQGISVSIVEPGNVDTDIWRSSYVQGKVLEEAFPTEAYSIYGRRFAARDEQSFTPKNKANPNQVAEAVKHALMARVPKIRYLVGEDAKKLYWMKKVLPERLFEKYFFG